MIWLWACGGSVSPADPPPAPAIPAPEAAKPPEPAAVAPIPQIFWHLPEHTVSSPVQAPLSPEAASAREALLAVVRSQAVDPDNPWAMKHAFVALGADFKLPDGSDPVDRLFADFAEPVALAGEDLIDFPASREAPGEDVRIEPHTDLLLKGLADAGVRPDRIVTVAGKPHPISDLYRSSLYRTWADGDRLWTVSWNDTPWTLNGLAAWAPPGLAWTAEGGHPMTIDQLTHAVAAKMHQETQFLRDAMASGAEVKKQKQGIFAYTCGGAHLIQGVSFAVARGFGEPGDRKLVEDEVGPLFYRYAIEIKTVDDALRVYPQYADVLLDQRLKFLGHFLETAHRLAAYGFYTPDASQKAILESARKELSNTVLVMNAAGTLAKIPSLKGGPQHQLYLDLVGDACHAVDGLDLSAGKQIVY